MQESLSEADRCRGGHYGSDANSVANLRGCASSPRRGGQLADYYPLIAQAVNRLEKSTGATRQTIYDRARAAMVAQLRSLTPVLNESDINHEQVALEKAIRKVETESLRRSPPPPHLSIRQSVPPSGTIRKTGDERAEISNAGGLSRYALGPRSPTVILANDEDKAGDDLALVKQFVPDLSAELEILQKEIRRSDPHGSPMIRRLVPLTIMGLLVIAVGATGAY